MKWGGGGIFLFVGRNSHQAESTTTDCRPHPYPPKLIQSAVFGILRNECGERAGDSPQLIAPILWRGKQQRRSIA